MSDEDAFGAELVVQDDGKESTSTSAQITPRASNLAPQSFSYKNDNSGTNNNNNSVWHAIAIVCSPQRRGAQDGFFLLALKIRT